MTLPTASAPTLTPAAPPDPANLNPTLPQGNGAAQRNNGASGAPSRSSRHKAKKGRKTLLAVIAGVLVVAAFVTGYVVIAKPFQQARTDLITHKVKYGRLELTIVERGALESANNHDITCRVKARSTTSQTSSVIKWVIDDGSQVLADRPVDEATSIISWDPKTLCFVEKPGNKNGKARVVEVHDKKAGRTYYSDLLIELDDSGLIEQLKDQKIVMDKAESDWIQAQQVYKFQEEKYKSDKLTAVTKLELAKIDLEKYLKGDYPQALKDVEGRIKIAESDVEQQRDRSAWAQRMLKKGYYTVSQSDSEQSKLQSLELNLAKVVEEKRVLTNDVYGDKKRKETDYKNSVEVAALGLSQVENQWLANEVQYRTDRDTKKSLYDQAVSKYKDIEEEIRKCKLYAPEDGLVVYYVAEKTRWGVGRQELVAQGEAVSENQKLMQIPDLKHMFVNAKIHEAMVARLRRGQSAMVRVESMSNQRLRGHVESVANTPSQQDMFAADVKVYATKVAVDEELEGLKPGMTAEVTITVADALEDVLTVPIQAIIGAAEMGSTRKCFVITPNGPEEREIVVGMSNEKEAEIKSGLKEGEEVVTNPKAIVGDKVKTREAGEYSNKNGGQEGNGKGRGKGPDGKGPGGPGGPGGPSGPGGPGGGMPKMNGGPGKAGGPPGGMQMSPEEMEKRRKEMIDRFRPLTPEKRKEMLQQVPEEFRNNARSALKAAGLEIAD
jgi:RND family efflux transporter MFP subunit